MMALGANDARNPARRPAPTANVEFQFEPSGSYGEVPYPLALVPDM